ncbi:MAG: MBL fold metallo-hydrolase [Candidatus Zixiibacteriota bacterium]
MLTPKSLRAVFLAVLILGVFVCDQRHGGRDAGFPTSPNTEQTPGSPDSPENPGTTGSSNDTLYIYCLDVGQGDATLIVSPAQQTMLVDAGKNGRGNSEVIPFLNNMGITSLDYIVATHYHEDHIGGIDEVIISLSLDSVDCVFDRGGSYSTQTYDDYVAAADTKRTTIELGQVISLGAGVSLTCVAVNAEALESGVSLGSAFNENDLSVALKLTYEEFDFFVGGDLSGADSGGYTDVETLTAPAVGKVEVYQVNHHGSKYSSNPFFLETLYPIVSIISVGNNSYGHPDPGTVTRLEEVSWEVLQTEDGDGNVVDGDVDIKYSPSSEDFFVKGSLYSIQLGNCVRP